MGKKQQMSEVCMIAHAIYATWKNGGRDALQAYFEVELEIPAAEAELFARNYNPAKPPAEVCPVEAVEKRLSSSKIFDQLSLQFAGISFADKGEEAIWPKNLLAYWVMRHVFGEETFDFKISGFHGSREAQVIFPNQPRDLKGGALNLGCAAIEAVEFQNLPAHVVKKAEILRQYLGDYNLGSDLAELMLRADIIFPPNKEVRAVAEAIKRGADGEKLILTGAFCPDYAYRSTGRLDIPFEYTFEGLGDGIGLVAEQFRRTVPMFSNWCKARGIHHQVKLGIGDFEANSAEILDRVGHTRDEFEEKCRASLRAFKAAMNGTPISLHLFEKEWAGERWLVYVEEAFRRMSRGDFGDIKLNTGKDPVAEVVNFLVKTSKKFYEAWYRRAMTENEVRTIVLQQGAEYAAFGRIIAEDFGDQPVIQIAGDRPKMQAFSGMYSKIPVLCTKRVY